MALSSMTGFGSAEGSSEGATLSVEVRSVNHRFLDVNCKLPQAFSRYEQELARIVRSQLKRGRVDLFLNRTERAEEGYETKFNEELFRTYLNITRRALKIAGIRERSGLPAAIPSILYRREVLEVGSSDRSVDGEWETVERLAREAVQRLSEMRAKEGAALEQELLGQLDTLQGIGTKIRELAAKAPSIFHDRLKQRLERLQPELEVDPGRLAQEVAILADRVDVTEELVRLDSHIKQFRQVIAGGEGGRKLEFLLQEVSREINTTGSKTQQSEITTLVVEAKSVVEKLREQVLNIE